jgi:hypothetical protein
LEIEEAINAYLLTEPGLTALIGNRIYPDEAEDGAVLPYVVYKDVDDIKNHTLEGQLPDENPVKQWTVYATTKKEAKAVARQIKAALKDYSGILSGIPVQHIMLLNELSDIAVISEDKRAYYTLLEFEISYERND